MLPASTTGVKLFFERTFTPESTRWPKGTHNLTRLPITDEELKEATRKVIEEGAIAQPSSYGVGAQLLLSQKFDYPMVLYDL